MKKTLSAWRQSVLPAMALYMAWTLYLFYPYRSFLQRWDFLLPINNVGAALGVWLLSRRWVGSGTGRLVAGAVYGFGPLAFFFMRFHPLAGTLLAATPWLFYPAVLASTPNTKRGPYSRVLACLWLCLPFVTMALFFTIGASMRRFTMPLYGTNPFWHSGMGVFFPCSAAAQGDLLWGFYHVALGPLIIGMGMLIQARRWAVGGVALLGIALACLPLLAKISPLAWLTIPHVVGALVVGMGYEGLIYAGQADRRWIIGVLATMMVFTLLGGVLGHPLLEDHLPIPIERAAFYSDSGKLYGLAVLVQGFLLLAIQRHFCITWLKRTIVTGALLVDLAICSRFIIGYVL